MDKCSCSADVHRQAYPQSILPRHTAGPIYHTTLLQANRRQVWSLCAQICVQNVQHTVTNWKTEMKLIWRTHSVGHFVFRYMGSAQSQALPSSLSRSPAAGPRDPGSLCLDTVTWIRSLIYITSHQQNLHQVVMAPSAAGPAGNFI